MVYTSNVIGARKTDEFAKWLKRLKDSDAKSRINLCIRRIDLTGNLGDCKPVEDGVYEPRINYGPGYRMYFAQRGKEIILLLSSGEINPSSNETSRRPKS